MSGRARISSWLLVVTVLATGAGLALWKDATLRRAVAASANQPEPIESVTVAVSAQRNYRPTTTAIGTVLALRSITLRNELPGTVRTARLTPGQIVAEGAVLVGLDVSVEKAELDAQQAQAVLAESILARLHRLRDKNAASEEAVDRARADRDVALAQIARTRAIIERKTIRAPFTARVGMADVHPGQYLNEGTLLTTLQGVDSAVHVDFTVEQKVAGLLLEGEQLEVFTSSTDAVPLMAMIVGIDARVDPATRNAMVRARMANVASAPAPGASVRVRVPVGPPRTAVAIPASALRKAAAGDHVFVLTADKDGKMRARFRPVQVGAQFGDEVVIDAGLAAGEQVAASGSFKLRDAVLVAFANVPANEPGPSP